MSSSLPRASRRQALAGLAAFGLPCAGTQAAKPAVSPDPVALPFKVAAKLTNVWAGGNKNAAR